MDILVNKKNRVVERQKYYQVSDRLMYPVRVVAGRDI